MNVIANENQGSVAVKLDTLDLMCTKQSSLFGLDAIQVQMANNVNSKVSKALHRLNQWIEDVYGATVAARNHHYNFEFAHRDPTADVPMFGVFIVVTVVVRV